MGCCTCTADINAAMYILENQPVKLSSVWAACYPSLKYKAYTAAKRLGKMPVVLVTLSRDRDTSSGGQNSCQAMYVLEKDLKIDYAVFYKVLDKFQASGDKAPVLSREKLASLQKLASTEKDKRLIKFAATSHLSSTKAKKMTWNWRA